MASEAERLLAGTGWLPEVLRTPGLDSPPLPFSSEGQPVSDGDEGFDDETLPAFLADVADQEFRPERLIAAE